jgi:hypothetical protein
MRQKTSNAQPAFASYGVAGAERPVTDSETISKFVVIFSGVSRITLVTNSSDA